MPEIGEIRKACEIGKKGHPSQKYIWAACVVCQKPRWMTETHYKKKESMRCHRCGGLGYCGPKHASWKGGRKIEAGYMMVWLPPESPFRPMANRRRYVREHRLLLAESLGRCLLPFEIVHHKNGDKLDNRLENLELSMPGAHSLSHSKGYRDGYLKGMNDGKDTRIKILLARIKEMEMA